jgi:thioredoxin-related protein
LPDNLLMASTPLLRQMINSSHNKTLSHALSRRRVLALPCLLLGAEVAQAKDTHLPRPKSLAQSAQQAHARGEPLVLLVSLPGCPYCELVRRSYLLPMREHEGLIAMQIDINDRKSPILGFDGQATNGYALSRLWGVKIAPTLYFFDAQGKEVAPKIEGVAVADFFGSYLEDRLKTARQNIAAANGTNKIKNESSR